MVICAGSGGVGKTTTAAALAHGLAERGLKVAVVTIDPARRLANALGLEELGNEPRRVDPERFAASIEMHGELWAMMLDAKRTFDELIEHLAPDERTRDEVLANRIYQQLSSAVAGSQEFTAIAKLYELDQRRRLRRARARHAAVAQRARLPRRARPPDRLLPGPRDPHLPAPGRASAGASSAAAPASCSRSLQRVTGVDLLRDLSVFFRSLGGMIDGFTERAERVGALLEDPATTFLIVDLAAPRPGRGGDLLPPQAARGAGCRSAAWSSTACTRVAATNGDVPARAGDGARRRAGRAGGALARASWPRWPPATRANVDAPARGARRPADVVVPELEDDVHDLDGLAQVRAHLFVRHAKGRIA